MKNKIISTMLAVAAVCIMVTGCAAVESKADDTVEMQKWGKAAGKEEKEIREDIDKSTVKPPIDFTVIK